MRVQNDNNGKSSYWVINPDAKPGKSNRRRSGSIDGQQKGEKKRRTKKLHQSTDDISALSPGTMKFKQQNRSFDNLFNIGSPCSSTDSLSNIDDYHGVEMGGYPYNSEAFGRPRSTSNVSNVSSVSGRMTPTQLDIDAELEQSNLMSQPVAGAEETANMVESMCIDPQHQPQQQRTMGNINLNDSMKHMKNNDMNYQNSPATNTDPLLPPRRPHSDSFGSGSSADSGYESPAYFSPPNQAGQNRAMGKMPSPGGVPNKPPPPYTQAYGNPMSRSQNMYPGANRMNNFYPNQANQNGQLAQQNRMAINTHMVTAPRLTHLPMQPQQSYTQQNMQTPFNNFGPAQGGMQQQQMNGGQYATHNNMISPNISMNQQQAAYQQQVQQQQQQFMKKNTPTVNVFDTEIPDDLSQVKLYDFQDQQQLASDLDAIIKNDQGVFRGLQNICGPVSTGNTNDTNNNSSIQSSASTFPLSGQNWVR